MMNTMRKFAGGFIAKLLMVFLIISFGVWGIGDILRNSGPSYAAKVGDETISIAEFQQQKSQLQQELEQMGMKGANVNALAGNILRKMVQQKLMLETMQDLGLYVNDELLTKELRNEPAFKNPDGTFNSNAFRSTARAQNIGEKGILDQVRGNSQIKFLIASIDMSDIAPPAPVRTLLTTAALETRDAWIVSLSPMSLSTPPTDDEIHAFYDKNKTVLYAEPENRTIEYIALKPAQLDELSDKAITDDMLQDAEKAQPKASKQSIRERLRTEQRDTTLHNFSGAVDDALAGGANLTDAVAKAGINAQAHTLDNANETLVKTSTDDVVKTVAEQGFQLGQGEASGIIVTPKGVPVIVYVKSVRAASPQDFDKVAADVKAHVLDEKRRDATRARIQEVKQALSALDQKQATDKQWQEVLKKFNLTARRVTNLARPADAKTTVDGIPPVLHQAIFERQNGTVAGPLTLDNGGQMLAIVTGIHHPSPTTVAGKMNALEEKSVKDLTTTLNQTVQMNAFNAFADRHKVKVNPQLLAQPAPGAAASDDEAP